MAEKIQERPFVSLSLLLSLYLVCREAFTTLTLTRRYVVNSVIFIISLHPSLVSYTSHTQCV